jgi:hypothetical protein
LAISQDLCVRANQHKEKLWQRNYSALQQSQTSQVESKNRKVSRKQVLQNTKICEQVCGLSSRSEKEASIGDVG